MVCDGVGICRTDLRPASETDLLKVRIAQLWLVTPVRPLDVPCKILVAQMNELLLTGRTKIRLIFMTPVVAALLACSTSRLSNYVKPYVGQNVQQLVSHLGKPTGKRESTGDLVYVWSADSEGVLPNNADPGNRPTTVTAHYECTLEVTVDAQGIIHSYEVEGSNAGCAAFHRHLIH